MTDTRYRIHQIRIRPGEDPAVLPAKVAKAARVRESEIRDLKIVRRSIDARRKPDVFFVYSVDFSCSRKLKLPVAEDKVMPAVRHGSRTMEGRPVIAGFGPCGMFAALTLAEQGYRPIVLERGGPMDERVRKVERFWKDGTLDPECNVQFGEGGAGTFSDGKLTTGIHDPRIRHVLEVFVRCGAPEEILIDQKPHIGTDKLRIVVRNVRRAVEDGGGEIRFHTRLAEVVREDGNVTGVIAEGPDGRVRIPTEAVILAIGHSSRDTLRELRREGIAMEQKPFSIGVRIEHPQEMIDRAQYGEAAGNPDLPPATYQLSWHVADGRGVYTFCMCPGGRVITCSSEAGGVVTNGMSDYARDSGTANSALLVDVRTTDFDDPDDPLSGVAFQERYERLAFENGGGNYRPPRTVWGDFRDRKKAAEPVESSLPAFCSDAIREAMPHLGRKLKGFDREDAVLTACETRSSSPVRILRDRESLESLPGLYPGGEGAGYAGGIMSSACDGIRIAEKIIEAFAPPSRV